jgi:hypothetical protein
MFKSVHKILHSSFARIDTGFSVSARCTNAAAFVHKTLTKSVPESLGTRLSEIVHIKIFRCLNTYYCYVRLKLSDKVF